MGQLSELHGRLLRLRLDARALAGEAEAASRETAAARGALESKALAEATENLWRVLDALSGKANFNPDQPRVPRGNSDGGQWTDDPAHGGGGTLRSGRSATRKKPRRGPIHVTIQPRPKGWRDAGKPPPRGDNSGFPDAPENQIPEVPRERPPTAKQRHNIVKTVARIGLRLVRTLSPLGRLMDLFEVGHWLYEEFAPYFEAYWDGPKTIEELRRDANFPAKGYDIHHVNEFAASKAVGFPDALINGPENLVRISRLMHWRITAYYQTPNPKFGWRTPRQYVSQLKTWEARTEFGLEVLKEFEVLK